MLISMTGYGIGSFEIEGYKFNAEIKSYNHKYLDVILKLPRHFSFLEHTIKKEINSYARRGRIEVFISIEDYSIEKVINIEKARQVYNVVKGIKNYLGIKDRASFSELMMLKEFFFINDDKVILSPQGIDLFMKNFGKLMDSFHKSRTKEGRELEKDIKKRTANLQKLIEKIEKRLPQLKKQLKIKIEKKLSELFEKENINGRLEQETLYYIDKMDVSEEIMRFKTHLKNINNILSLKDEAGKKLDFYTQELLREINTLSVKSQDADISKIVVDVKSEIEKIREQAQNVE